MKNLTEIFSDFEKGKQKWGHRNSAEHREEKKCIPDRRDILFHFDEMFSKSKGDFFF